MADQKLQEKLTEIQGIKNKWAEAESKMQQALDAENAAQTAEEKAGIHNDSVSFF